LAMASSVRYIGKTIARVLNSFARVSNSFVPNETPSYPTSQSESSC